MSAEYYDRLEINWSSLKHLWQGSPLHYAHHRRWPEGDTTARMMGRVLHMLVLEPDRVRDEVTVWTEGDRRGKAWQEFASANDGKIILKPGEMLLLEAQAAAVAAHGPAASILAAGAHEVPMYWTCPDTGLECKGLADVLGGGVLADLKGCGGVALLERTAYRSGYAHQLAWYRRGAMELGHDVSRVSLIGVEGDAPHDVAVLDLSPELLAHCDRELTALMHRLAECIETDHWPGRYPEPVPMPLPTWAVSDDVSIPEEVSLDY